MSDILDLEGWILLTRAQEDGWDILDAEYRHQPAACPKCGTIGHLYRLKAQDGRCGLCAVEIGRAANTRPVAATLLRRSTRKQVVICHGYMTGFHTQRLFHKVPRSTRESG